jgi:hypothetical protein
MIDFSLDLGMPSLRAIGPREIVIGKGLIEAGQEILRDTKGNEVENLPVLAIVLQQPREKGLQYRIPRRQTNWIRPLRLLHIIPVGALDACREDMESLLAQTPQRYLEMTAAGGMVLTTIVAKTIRRIKLVLAGNQVRPMSFK